MLRKREVDLILTGPGTPFISYAGAVKCLEENGISIRRKISVSGGSIISSLLDEGYKADDILSAIKKIDLSTLVDYNFSIDRKGLLKGKKILDKLNELFLDKLIINRLSTIIVTEEESGKPCYITYKNVLKIKDVIRASLSIPLIFEPYEINGKYYIDGGSSNNYPYEYFKDSDLPVLALKVSQPKTNKTLKDLNILEYSGKVISQLITAQEYKGKYNSNIVDIKINYSNFDFNLKSKDYDILFKNGYDATYLFLKENNRNIFN